MYFLLSLLVSIANAGWQTQSCDTAQVQTLNTHAAKAVQCLSHAQDLIQNDWEKLKKDFNWTGTPKSYFQVLFVDGNREFYSRVIQNALKDHSANGMRFKCDRSCPEDRIAYTVFTFGKPYKPIHFCPLYFRNPSWGIVSHEFGRLYGSIEGDSAFDRTNIYVWDRIIEVLCGS